MIIYPQPDGLGALCTLHQVTERLFGTSTTSDLNTEILNLIIAGVSADIEGYCGRWLAPRPTNLATTTTLLFDVGRTSRSLVLEQGHRICGVRSVTAVGAATVSQPETGGSYTSATLADVLIRPRATADGPGNRLELTPYPTGPVTFFYWGYNTVSVTGSFGFASVPYDIQEVAIAAVTRRFIGKESATPIVTVGPEGTPLFLNDLSAGNRATLNRYRWPIAA